MRKQCHLLFQETVEPNEKKIKIKSRDGDTPATWGVRKYKDIKIKVYTHVNKGRDKQFYMDRAKVNNRDLNWS